jgi:hypothetical protein
MGENHEDQLCDTIVQFITQRKSVSICGIDCPDEEKDTNLPSVDRLIRCSGVEIVLEHTLVESYPEQIADVCRVKEIMGLVKSKVQGSLPVPGHYEVSLGAGAVKGAKNTKTIQEALVRWIKSKAPSLLIGSPDVAPHHYITERLTGIPFEITLYRWPRNDGKFRFTFFAPDDLEAKRIERISKALERKCPKLNKARGYSRVSILLLEADDISLGNHLLIGKALKSALLPRRDVPDDIYLVETELREWCVWILKEGDKSFENVEDPGPHYLHAP